VLDSCSSYCRYCTRSRMVGHGEMVPNQERLELALDYIRRTPAIRDVLSPAAIRSCSASSGWIGC